MASSSTMHFFTATTLFKSSRSFVSLCVCVACSAECDRVAFCRACNTHFLVDFSLFHLQCTANFKGCIIVFYFSFLYYVFAVPLCNTGRAQFSKLIRCIFFFCLHPRVSSLSQSALKIMLEVALYSTSKLAKNISLIFVESRWRTETFLPTCWQTF